VLREQKFVIEEATYPSGIPYDAVTELIVMAEGSAAFENLICSEKLSLLADEAQQAGFLAGLNISAADYLRALRIRTEAMRALNSLWQQFDLLIAPTLLLPATPISQALSANPRPWGGNGGPGNLAGWPSLSLPMGFGAEGLPYGLEIIGPPLSEQALLSLGMLYQRETDWHRRTPDI
jgi:Asp-tRNA(Asn)/Glu-tRNA(Gln) amidotransferase A subunit family amidase